MKIKKVMALILFLITLTFSLSGYADNVTEWQNVAPGLDYAKINLSSIPFTGAIYAFRINLKRYKLKLVLSKARYTSVRDLVLTHQALLGVNGGFFSPNLKPLGLRMNAGKILHRIKHISWWGVFYIRNNKASIVSQRQFHRLRGMTFAIQSGPRLIINGHIPSLKPGMDNRTALGITRDGDVIILATENAPISTEQLAKLMRKPYKQGGLNCVNALNLDGGTSTQIYAEIDDFNLNIPGFSPIADAVLVLPRAS